MINRNTRLLLHLALGLLPIVLFVGRSSLQGQTPPITDVAFAPDGNSLVSCSQTGLQVFSWPELRLQKSVDVSVANLHCLVFSPDGKQLAVGGGEPSEAGVVEVFSWPDCKSQLNLSDHDDSVMSVVWRGNKSLVSASLDRSLILWDLDRQAAVKTYRGHSRGVSSACILNSGEIVTAGHDRSVRVWEGESGELLQSLNQHTKPVNSMAVHPISKGASMIATAAGDRSIRFWQPTIGRMIRYVRLESEPLDIAWLNESQIVASCVDGQARVVDAENVTVFQTIPAIEGWAYAVATHPRDGTIAIAGSHGQLQRIRPK